MAAYTIEDIELIRSKSGISYQEAVSLLDYHNGNVARALVDLERNGRIKQQSTQKRPGSSSSEHSKSSSTKNGFIDLITKLYRARIKIKKDDVTVLNVSALFGIAGLVFAPHMLIAGGIASLVLGYKFSFVKNDPDFASENLERMVRNAADNVKSSVSDFTRGFQEGSSGNVGNAGNAGVNSHPYAPSGSQPQSTETDRSFYANHSSAASYRANVPTMTFPVQVEGQDGSVTVEGDAEGYTSATIE